VIKFKKVKKQEVLSAILCLYFIFLLTPNYLEGQLLLGQYEDEAPLGTWNIFGIKNATSLAMGDIPFITSSDCSVALSNPSLLQKLPKFNLIFNSSYSSVSLAKYSLINTGVLFTPKNPYLKEYAFDFAGLALKLKEWAFSLSLSLLESYARPSALYEYHSGGSLIYSLSFEQTGILKNLNFSLSRKINKLLSVGLGINYIFGYMKKVIEEEWGSLEISMSDEKDHDFKGFYLNGGLNFEISRRLNMVMVFRSAYEKKSQSKSHLRYYSPQTETDIRIDAFAESKFKQPLLLGFGLSSALLPNLKIALGLTFFNWSKYRVLFFEEERARNFRDILKFGGGIEYAPPLEFFGRKINLPLRLGFSLDPQPMEKPRSSYLCFSFGAGIRFDNLALNGGISLGREKGSGDSLQARKIALTLSYSL